MELRIFDRLPDKYKKILPYMLVIVSFAVAVVLLVIIIDSLVMPSLILNRESVKVPNVTGMSYSKAEQLLLDKKLVIYKVNEQYSELVPKGKIINQSPKPYQMVKEGRSVYLTVSKGLETVLAPYLIGLSSRSARVLLMNKGLNIGNVEYTYSDIYGNDTVIQQRILSGQDIPYGSTIDVMISKGPERQVLVPNVEQSDFVEAQSLLSESGLVVGTIEYEISDTYMPNTVLFQDPFAGTLVHKGAAINLIIAK